MTHFSQKSKCGRGSYLPWGQRRCLEELWTS